VSDIRGIVQIKKRYKVEPTIEKRKIEIEEKTLKNLNTTRKWTMFLAIMGFIILGLIIAVGLLAGTFLTIFNSGVKVPGVPESLIFLPILLVALIYFFPVLFLFRFSKHAGNAIQTLDKEELYKAIRSLKSYFVYIGVLIIIVLSGYITLLIFAGTSMSFLKGIV
jgi:hypothetical protein